MTRYVYISTHYCSGDRRFNVSQPSNLQETQRSVDRLINLKNVPSSKLKVIKFNLPEERFNQFKQTHNLLHNNLLTEEQLRSLLEENTKYSAQSLRFYAAKYLLKNPQLVNTEKTSNEAMADINEVGHFFALGTIC